MTTDMTVRESGAAIAEQVIVKGDLAKLTEAERMAYYGEVCRSLGLNPLTRPFEYITLNGKLTLYATRGAGDQLRASRGISISSLEPKQIGDLYVVIAIGRDRDGREDSSTGAVSIKGLVGEALANAMMKCETKAKRRLTLSLAGLGWPDESEVVTVPGAARADVDPETGEIRRPVSLAERVSEKAARIAAVEQAEAPDDGGRAADAIVFAALEGVVEGIDEMAAGGPNPLSRVAFNRLALDAHVTKADIAAAREWLGVAKDAELTDDDYGHLAVRLGLVL